MTDCVFCKIVEGEIPSFKIWENDKYLLFLDINPVQTGHSLLIPKEHHGDLFDMNVNEYNKIMDTAKSLGLKLRSSMKSKRVGMVVEGFAVNHVHIHLVPINHGGELHPKNIRTPSKEELQSIHEKLSSDFKSILQ